RRLEKGLDPGHPLAQRDDVLAQCAELLARGSRKRGNLPADGFHSLREQDRLAQCLQDIAHHQRPPPAALRWRGFAGRADAPGRFVRFGADLSPVRLVRSSRRYCSVASISASAVSSARAVLAFCSTSASRASRISSSVTAL